MDIKLKSIKILDRMSEETTCFEATIYLGDKKIGFASNNGHGGSTNYIANNPANKKVIAEIEQYCIEQHKKYPEKDIDNFEYWIDNFIYEYSMKKELEKVIKKLDKLQSNNIVMVEKNLNSYTQIKLSIPIVAVLLQEHNKILLQNLLNDKTKKFLLGDSKYLLFNNNIPQEMLEAANITKEMLYNRP